MYVDGSTADTIFSSIEVRIIFKDIAVPVVSAEHLIAMKLFAAHNNPDRVFKELSDIKEVVKYAKVKAINIK